MRQKSGHATRLAILFGASTLVAAFGLSACNSDPTGQDCSVDEDCGPGFDCYPDVCTRVCTKTDECPQGETCFRYHCIVPGTENQPRARKKSNNAPSTKSSNPQPPPAANLRPPAPSMPLPDASGAELRAIRRELELLRRDQIRLMTALEKQGLLPPEPTMPPSAAPSGGGPTSQPVGPGKRVVTPAKP